jgi:glutaredoxin 2
MTLFTKDDCSLCTKLKKQFDLRAMEVHIEVLDNNNAGALAHLAWHGLVETARKKLPILVLDDSSAVDEFMEIEKFLLSRADERGVKFKRTTSGSSCENGSCSLQ